MLMERLQMPQGAISARPGGATLRDVLGQAPGGMPAPIARGPAPEPGRPAANTPPTPRNYGLMLAEVIGPRPEMSRGQKIASVVAPMLLAASGDSAGAQRAIAGIGAQQRDWDERSRAAALEAIRWQREDDAAEAKRDEPQFFSGSEDRVRFDPVTGEATRVYDAPTDFEDYAAAKGLQPGSPEYFAAVEDYVLRGNGPTAFKYDRDLEAIRSASRQSLEAARQRNRLQLRQTPQARQSGTASGGASPRRARPTATNAEGRTLEWNGTSWVPVR